MLWYGLFLLGFNAELYAFVPPHLKFPWWAHFAAIALMVFWPAAYAYSRTLTTLRLTRRHEGGFWRRNADKIILLVIGAAVGAVIGGIATYVVTMLTRTR